MGITFAVFALAATSAVGPAVARGVPTFVAAHAAIVQVEAPLARPAAGPPGAGQPNDAAPPLTPRIRPRPGDLGPKQAPEQVPEQVPEHRRGGMSDGAPGGKAQPAPKTPWQVQPAPKTLPNPSKKADAVIPGKPVKPGLAVAQPRTAAERDKALADLYALLATAEDARQAETISASIEQLWVTPGSDTISLLMQRAMHAADAKNPELALKLLDAVVALAPDYAEGWNRRAYVHYTQNHMDLALGDLRRTLALDPNHFKALDGLVHMLQETGHKKAALAVARKLLDVNPFYEGAKRIVDELSREIEDRGI